MYRRPKFLEILLEIRQEMALAADYDVELFAERVRTGTEPAAETSKNGDASAKKIRVRPKSKVKISSKEIIPTTDYRLPTTDY